MTNIVGILSNYLFLSLFFLQIICQILLTAFQILTTRSSIAQIGLPVINFHGLRHTNATLLISQNIDVAVLAARLGHAQITTTFNFYVHPIISHNRKAGNVLENLLLPQKLV